MREGWPMNAPETAEYSTRLNEQFRRLESMALQRASDEVEIRQRIHRWLEALRAMDLEGVMSFYAPDIVSFDIVPPLRHGGAKAKEKNWMDVFATYERPLGYEIRDLTLIVGHDVAFGHSLNRVSGTSKNGNRTDVWGAVDGVLSEDRRQLARRARPCLRAYRS